MGIKKAVKQAYKIISYFTMKPFEKELFSIIQTIDETKIFPVEKTVTRQIERDTYHFLLVRGLIEKKPFKEKDESISYEIHVTPQGYSYFLEKKYRRRTYIVNTILSIIISALSGIAGSAIFARIG